MSKYFHSLLVFWHELYWFLRWSIIGSLILSIVFFKSASVTLVAILLLNITRVNSYYDNGKKLRESFPSREEFVKAAAQFSVSVWGVSIGSYFLSKLLYWSTMHHQSFYQLAWYNDIRFVYAITSLMIIFFPQFIIYTWHGKKEDWSYTLGPAQATVAIVAFSILIIPTFLPFKFTGIILTLASGFVAGIVLFSLKKIQEFLAS